MKRLFSLSVFAAVHCLLAFGLQCYVALAIGARGSSDAYYASASLPQIVLAVLASAAMPILVPLLASQSEASFGAAAWGLLQVITLVLCGLGLVAGLAAPFWVPYLVPGFDAAQCDLTVALLRIHLVGMVFTAAVYVLSAVHYARDRFLLVEFRGACATLVSIGAAVLLVPRHGVYGAAVASNLRAVLYAVLLLRGVGAFHPLRLADPVLLRGWRRMRPLLLSSCYSKLDVLVDRYCASLAPAGSLSLLYLATQLYGMGNQVLGVAVANPLVPSLARAACDSEWGLYRRLVAQALRRMALLVLPCLLLLAAVGRPVLALAATRSALTEHDTAELWALLLALCGVWVGGALGQVLAAAFSARGSTGTLALIGIVGFTIGMGFKVGGFLIGGVFGLAVGTSCYYFMNLTWLWVAHGAAGFDRPAAATVPAKGEMTHDAV